jgi:hypothetical protein
VVRGSQPDACVFEQGLLGSADLASFAKSEPRHLSVDTSNLLEASMTGGLDSSI